MPWEKMSDAPVNGGASSIRGRSTGPRVHLEAVVKHPSNATAPRLIDRGRMYEQILPKDPEKVQWPRATVRASPGMAAGELVWGAKVWSAPDVEARDVNGLLVAFSGHDRQKVLTDAAKRVRELRWSKVGRLRLEGPPEVPEPPC